MSRKRKKSNVHVFAILKKDKSYMLNWFVNNFIVHLAIGPITSLKD